MKRFLTSLLCLGLAGCFRESRQPQLTVTAAPAVAVRLVDEPAAAMALVRIAGHYELAVGIPAAAQREYFEVFGATGALTADASGKIKIPDFAAQPFIVGFDGTHFWLVDTGEARTNVLALGADNEGGPRAIKSLTSVRPSLIQFFASRLLAESEATLQRKEFDTARLLAQNARLFAANPADALVATINQRQAESLLQSGEEARRRRGTGLRAIALNARRCCCRKRSVRPRRRCCSACSKTRAASCAVSLVTGRR